jgi:hypothetical protein
MGRDVHPSHKLAHYARACTDITFRCVAVPVAVVSAVIVVLYLCTRCNAQQHQARFVAVVDLSTANAHGSSLVSAVYTRCTSSTHRCSSILIKVCSLLRFCLLLSNCRFPFGQSELQGVAARGNYDLTQHQVLLTSMILHTTYYCR